MWAAPETRYDEEAQLNRTHVRRVLYGVGIVFTVLVIAALIKSLLADGPAALAAWRRSDADIRWIVAAFACGLVGHALNIIGWHRLLRDMGVTVSTRVVTRLFFLSNLGRYLPGAKAWQLGIVGMMATEHGISPGAVVGSSLFGGILGVGVGLLLLFAFGGAAIGMSPLWIVLAAASLVALLLAPAGLRLFPAVQAVISARLPVIAPISVRTMWTLVWTASTSWVAWGVGLYCLARALLDGAGASVVNYVTAWIGPFLVGLLAVLAPAGLGARDGTMNEILVASGLAVGNALMISLVARVWGTALDVIPALIVVLFRTRSDTHNRHCS